ncbi:hypothetical protein [Companilactobacillus versmoldensis]|uniref:Bacteriocin immunity protein n=1 Tax=Companilactobacillus versmoldensis DSM 14857 = KCTC 3814 TaxID=1423815 RepID=A0A0R1SHE1_9LACO|nr:hypothetical protein [Companilactobacillus versmoldensis]KRL66122.1 hypothetical protein FC27_GL001051 [Companilactobacillus versmoldensis DSM 14857 = KCTC 3814]
MKYTKKDAEKLLSLTEKCLDDPDIMADDKLNLLIGDLNQKITYQKRYKNLTPLRKQAGVYVRNHGFMMPKPLNDLLSTLNEVNVRQSSKHGWLQGFLN